MEKQWNWGHSDGLCLLVGVFNKQNLEEAFKVYGKVCWLCKIVKKKKEFRGSLDS